MPEYSGSPIQTDGVYFARDFFTYELDFSGLGPGLTQTQSFVIQADADFLLTKLTFAAFDGTGAFVANPEVSILLQDGGSGRNLMSQSVPVGNLFGSGSLPFILPRQRLFVSRSQVQVTATNFSATNTYNVRLSFIGEKGFRK